MARSNPRGYPLSGDDFEATDGEFVVEYRPRVAGQRRRPRVQVPAQVAEQLRRSQAAEVSERHQLMDSPPRPRKKRARKKAAKRTTAKRTTAKRTTAKRTAKRTTAKRTTAKRTTAKSAARKVATAARAVAEVAEEAAERPTPIQGDLFKNPRRRGAPNLAHLGAVAQLGQVLELIVETPNGGQEVHRWRANRPTLLWSPRQKCLIWVFGRRPAARRKGASRADGAARTFERWAQRPAASTSSIDIPSKPLQALGRALQIVYRSDKWGQVATYEHDFSAGARAYGAGPVFAVRGGALTVTERGIVY